MKTAPKITLVHKSGDPSIAKAITLDEYWIYANAGDVLDVLGNKTTVINKVFKFKAFDEYSIEIVYE
ncbi:hypothetical protein IFR35_08330 [Pseudomonas fluorescens]|uniref:hypothetical protein n=1 Tax=Pseudomonas fluorescens TaxID=294 RepID=UPI00177D0B5F|nr:hypothetical protein [Pseudomonas fluorescens]MBD8191768.1 hypothetical protein [Pseudomonas fluorescens]MBD8226497.1 hypothetical protein [Pseudomonas fluorescens]MBD8784210.1 hypothetical protein [Pseudomonas fluorescens]MBD8816890.1 hypothetical protein [Pseudomonas fluorescens]